MDYPIEYTAADFAADTGTTLELEGIPPKKQTPFLAAAHRAVYNYIYSGCGKPFKDNLIRNNADRLRPALRDALCVQVRYMLDAGGDYAATSATHLSESGELVLGDNDAIRGKLVAPGVESILRGQIPDILIGCTAPSQQGSAVTQ